MKGWGWKAGGRYQLGQAMRVGFTYLQSFLHDNIYALPSGSKGEVFNHSFPVGDISQAKIKSGAPGVVSLWEKAAAAVGDSCAVPGLEELFASPPDYVLLLLP